ncbi:retropepsin-like aspartic protease [Phormidium sp. CCY1219]|uniref:retropepsin-like aspartic protease n=1 Tax=Phormidium sp. CCY1219 TaxID=2886104 RepID=UPI002D1E9CA3|nr:retropepsin-like aspartic protease [Phormidium sp. CCY1219]MEB3831767.1 retropepsin-like domain-containing protein [Phormidium sp. CCY1219]
MTDFQKAYRLSRHGKNLLKVQAMAGGMQKGDFARVKLIIDTGSSFTILPVQVVETLGYDTQNTRFREEIITGKGKINAPVIQLTWFNCVGQILYDFPIVAYNIPARLRVDGLLGMDFLQSCQAVLSIHNAEITCKRMR